MRKPMVAGLVLMIFLSDGRAQTLTECGKSDGYAYYFTGGLVPAGKGGWQKDGIEDGRIILNFINGEIDLLIKDRTGNTRSPLGQRNRDLVNCQDCWRCY